MAEKWGLFTSEGAEALRNYKYFGSDLSLTYKYALSPLAEAVVQRYIPLWMAPNLITLLGLLFPAFSLIIFATLCPSLKTDPPAWAFFFNAFALLAYQTLDNMDGKQARRTKSSNALGMIFDHGCDAINAGVGAINLLVVLGIVSGQKEEVWDPFLVLSALATPFVPFFIATWEEYYVGQLVLPIINGPSEGVLLGVAISTISGIYGPSVWQKDLTWLPSWVPINIRHPGDLLGWFSIIGVLITCLMQITDVIRLQQRQTKCVIKPLADLLPFVLLSGGTAILIIHTPTLFIDCPLISMGAISALFVEQVVALMIAHMSHQEYLPQNRILLAPFTLLVLLAYSGLTDKGTLQAFWGAHFVLVSSYTAVYLTVIVADLTHLLDVYAFRIKPPQQAASTTYGHVGNKSDR